MNTFISKHESSFFILFLLVLQNQPGEAVSPTPDKKTNHTPLVNISGILIDYTGQSHSVEWITIDGAYEDIPVFQEPPTADINPSIATTKLQLAAVQRIVAANTQEQNSARSVTFAGKEYVKIIVYTHGISNGIPYLIDKGTHLVCQAQPAPSGQRHEFSFEAVKELIIQNVSVPSREPKPTQHAYLGKFLQNDGYGIRLYNAVAQSLKTFFDGVTSMAQYLWV